MQKILEDLLSENMNQWLAIPRCREGEKIYHYTNLSSLKGIVTEHSFWVTKSDFLNDKNEFRYAYKVTKKVCEKLVPNESNRTLLQKMLKAKVAELNTLVEDQVMSGCYVLSFSKGYDSLLLWTEFAKSQGYCMEFDYSQLRSGIHKKMKMDGYVIYNRKEQCTLVENTFLRVLKRKDDSRRVLRKKLFSETEIVTEEELEQFVSEFALCSFLYSMFFKKECFQEEQEYRFVFWAFHEENGMEIVPELTPIHFRERAQTLIPYIEVGYAHNKGQNPIRAITVGPKNNSDLAVKGIRYFLRNEKINIPVCESKIPLRY
ncbi:MAG: DUF2971 domain-containing protein [Eubacteriales bacterium]|nr:DUF2971 domain-containing protein [Eubacteriales bacterium]